MTRRILGRNDFCGFEALSDVWGGILALRGGGVHPMSAGWFGGVGMRKTWAKDVLAVGVGLAVILGVGCKRQPAPVVQPRAVVKSAVPRAEPELGPYEDDDPMPKGSQPAEAHRHRVVLAPVVPPEPDPQLVAAEAEARQREQDGRLWQQQAVESQKAQEELDHEVQRAQKEQDEMQEEPRIQDAPTVDMGQPVQPGEEQERIQDAPGPSQGWPTQLSAPRIQDAPGPVQAIPQLP
jgi:hypothetical protein